MIAAKQDVFRVRRRYNQWVNNQTLEDYALRFTAKGARRWSLARVANTALGAISFLALEAIGAAITINYGFDNAVVAIIIVCTLIFFAGLPICYHAAKYGVDIDLLTRGAGFGYLGSTATSLIYSSFTFIFFALEAAIMAKALELLFGFPLAIGYVISSLIVIPLVFHGITFISRFQLWTQPIWLILQILPFIFILQHDSGVITEWKNYIGSKQQGAGVNFLLVGSAAAVMFSLVAQIGEQVDFLRFLPEKTQKNRKRWWAALILSGPGWTIVGAIKILAGSFLAVVALKHGIALVDAGDPTTMYSVAFYYVTDNAEFALILAGVFVVISQLKINVTNAYAGSIAWSNFFSRLTHSHPGRVVWLIFNVCIALLLMELGIYRTFENTLSVYAIVAVSWVGSIVADLVINKPLGLSPNYIEFKRAHLYNVNPVGVGSMVIASALGITCYLGILGESTRALAHFIALAATLVCVPLIALLTKSKYYIARTPYVFSDKTEAIDCIICRNKFEQEDAAHCPAYEGYICSLCCSIDGRCQDSCKTKDGFGRRIFIAVKRAAPRRLSVYINYRLVNFLGLLTLVASITGILLSIIYANIHTDNQQFDQLIAQTLWKVFFILLIVAGVISWLFVLANESRSVAQEESHRQTRRLRDEIEAHTETDQKLQAAKELAEAANNAKSRYLTGISHELRTPLNSILGYAQLLEMDRSLPKYVTEQLNIIRHSSAHLGDLIEGLLDISKIEAGRLEIHRDAIQLEQVMNQIVSMFSLQAQEKGLDFRYEKRSLLPALVQGDEKRLRQILINLLSNAIKYTPKGHVIFSVHYRNQVMEIKISDTGIGIPEDEMERIFRPFERVRQPNTPSVMGTGLGLTITRLLTDIMGGNIDVANNTQGGACFTVQLAFPQLHHRASNVLEPNEICGYDGKRLSIMVVDDDFSHRSLMKHFLMPLGFSVIEASDAQTCLTMVSNFTPDLFLLDRLMPGMDGATLAKKLRMLGIETPIMLISANATEDGLDDDDEPAYNAYLAKPIKLGNLTQSLAQHLNINWHYNNTEQPVISNTDTPFRLPEKNVCLLLCELAEIGHMAALRELIEKLENDDSMDTRVIAKLSQYVKDAHFKKIIEFITVHTHDS